MISTKKNKYRKPLVSIHYVRGVNGDKIPGGVDYIDYEDQFTIWPKDCVGFLTWEEAVDGYGKKSLPTVQQMCKIQTFFNEINQLLVESGGQVIQPSSYWTREEVFWKPGNNWSHALAHNFGVMDEREITKSSKISLRCINDLNYSET